MALVIGSCAKFVGAALDAASTAYSSGSPVARRLPSERREAVGGKRGQPDGGSDGAEHAPVVTTTASDGALLLPAVTARTRHVPAGAPAMANRGSTLPGIGGDARHDRF